MKIEVLGCSGAEFPGHYPPGFLMDEKILFDAGTLNNVLDEKNQLKIKNIFITHAHMDHIREIPFLADNIIIGGWKSRVTIFSISSAIKDIRENLLNSKLWPDMTVLPNAHDAVVRLISMKAEIPYRIGTYSVTPYKVNHSVPAVGYLVENREKRRFFYTGDTGPTDGTWKRLGKKPIHCLIIEVSFPNHMEEIAIASGHLTPQLLQRELLKIEAMPERIYITHLKPQFYTAIKKELQRLKVINLTLLKEGDVIQV
jgi:ribonuclease BN (tRNA processing enzyme)